MTADQLNQLSLFVLKMLAVSGRIGLEADILLSEVRTRLNREATLPQVMTALRAHADKALAVEFTPIVGTARWRITDLGRSVAEEAGLA